MSFKKSKRGYKPHPRFRTHLLGKPLDPGVYTITIENVIWHKRTGVVEIVMKPEEQGATL